MLFACAAQDCGPGKPPQVWCKLLEVCRQGFCYYHPETLATSQHLAQAKAQLDKGLAELKIYRAAPADW